jgi:hypothetical protein
VISSAATTIGQRISSAAASHDVEAPIDECRQPSLLTICVHEPRAHHRRQRHRHDAGDDDRRRQRDRELEEQRTRQAALKRQRRVDGRQRDRHRDDRAPQLACGQ